MRRCAAAVLALSFALHTAPMVFAQAGQARATLSGTAHNSSGKALANFATQLRNVETGVLVGKTLSSGIGSFSFTGLSAASYVVEVVDVAGLVIGASAITPVSAGANVSVAVQAAGGAGNNGRGVNMAILLTALASSIGVAAIVIAANQDEASPSR